jgi:hypothetical protein
MPVSGPARRRPERKSATKLRSILIEDQPLRKAVPDRAAGLTALLVSLPKNGLESAK